MSIFTSNDGLIFVLYLEKMVMIEQQSVNGKDVWIKVDAHPVERENPNIIPTEYFTATYYLQHPVNGNADGEKMKDEDGETKLFESPVAALTEARKHVENQLNALSAS